MWAVMSMFADFIAKERLVGALHMQLVSGVHPVVFWLSNLSFDFLVYFISTGLVVIAFATHKEPAYVEGADWAWCCWSCCSTAGPSST
nr:hypothetical protein BaRGS_003559 [Batillaria attramentaria]